MSFSEHLRKHFFEDDWETDNKDSEKLKRVVDLCKRTITNFTTDNDENAYAKGRIMTAKQVLEVIKGEI